MYKRHMFWSVCRDVVFAVDCGVRFYDDPIQFHVLHEKSTVSRSRIHVSVQGVDGMRFFDFAIVVDQEAV